MDCNATLKNSKGTGCPNLMDIATLPILWPEYGEDGTRNEFASTSEITSSNLITLINEGTDAFDRLYPLEIVENVEDVKEDSAFYEFASGRKIKNREGVRKCTMYIPFQGTKHLEKIASWRDKKFGLFFGDRANNFIYITDSETKTKVRPILVNEATWEAVLVKKTEADPGMIMISFEFRDSEADEYLRYIEAENLDFDVNQDIYGLLDVDSVISDITDVGFTLTLTTGYGAPVTGLVAADFFSIRGGTASRLFNLNSSSNVTITSFSEGELGVYAIGFSSQAGGELRITPVKNRFDFKNVIAETVTIEGTSYSEAAMAFFAELATQPDDAVKVAIDNFYVDVADEIAEHDIIYLGLAQTEDHKMTNLVDPAAFYQAKIGSPVFTPFGGIKGASSSAYNSTFVPSTDGVKVALNSASFWFYNQSSALGNGQYLVGCGVAGEAGMLAAYFNNNPRLVGGVNTYNEIAYNMGSNTRFGMWHVSKTGSTITVYHEGVSVYTVSVASVALANVAFYELACNLGGTLTGAYTSKTILASGVGSGAIDPVALYEGVKNYIGDLPLWKFYGDSIFAGYSFSDPSTESIPAQLCALTGNKYALNWSISGTKISDLYDSGVKIERCNNADDIVFFDYIVNDAVGSLNTTTFGNNYRSKIEEAIDGGATKVVLIIPYVTDTAVTSVWGPYVTIVQTIAGEYPEVQLIDMRATPYTLSDGTHPTTAGAAAAAALIFAEL